MRALFWGTSDFALPTLRALAGSRHTLAGVVTQPDRPAGRGRELRSTPVKRAAEELGARLLQPEAPEGREFLDRLEELAADVSVVAAYGEILTEEVLEAPRLDSVNVHASLLPALRGAAPVNWAIIRGHGRTGVTIMRMVRELDAGPILRQVEVGVEPRQTAGELFEELAELGAGALLETLDELEAGEAEAVEQAHERATYAPKLDRETARVEWSLPAVELDRWIRGCDPWPAAWSELEDREGGRRRVQLFDPLPDPPPPEGAGVPTAEDEPPGTVLMADPREGLRVATGDGVLEVGQVKPSGKRRMEAAAWIRGRGASAGQRFV